MKRLMRRLLGLEKESAMAPVMMLSGGRWKLMTHVELEAMKKRWAEALAGHAQDPEMRAVIEMASGLMQTRKEHAGNARLVSYAAGLNDLMLEVLRLMSPRGGAPDI